MSYFGPAGAGRLSAEHLRDSIEVAVARDQNEVVFQDQRRDPKSIVRNGSSGSPELNEKTRILLRPTHCSVSSTLPRNRSVIRFVSSASLTSTYPGQSAVDSR